MSASSSSSSASSSHSADSPGAIPDCHHVLEFPYTRTTGSFVGPFLTGLRDGKILGNRISTADGHRVFCPPLEYHPETAAAVEPDFAEVGPGGEVVSWTWVQHPTAKHPLDEPFAFAQILLDGADTPLPHAIKASSSDDISTGMRVMAQWRQDRQGSITDIFFVPEAGAAAGAVPAAGAAPAAEAVPVAAPAPDTIARQDITPGEEPVTITEHVISLTISEPLHDHRRRFAEGLLAGKIIAQRSPASGKIYVPGRGFDPMERVAITQADELEVADVGTVVGFTEINPVQYHGQKETQPYIRCSILLDGADQPVQGIDIRHITVADFRIGMRLKAVWRPPAERKILDMDNRFGSIPESVVERWDPTGEPDVDPASLKEHAI